jgi:beta-lactam-binding protein with PASTA domain
MATRRELPADLASAFDRVPEAGDRFEALPPERQTEWLDWLDRATDRDDRAARRDELIRRMLPAEAAETEEIAPAAPPPAERHWWLWLLLLLLLVVGGLLAWYFLTRGNDKSTVPNVIGLQEDVAAQRIDESGLKSVPRTGQSERPQGVVFAQKPGAGTQLDEGQTVTISISAGRQAVPDVTGLQEQQAVQQLQDAGLQAQVRRVPSTRPKGTVLTQSPGAGVVATSGTTVTLTVSNGVKPVVVPSVVGKQQGAAVDTLTGLGLEADLNNVSSARPAGTVVAQKPAGGQEVAKGSTVTLNVSTGSGGGGGGGTTTSTTPTITTTTTTTTQRTTTQVTTTQGAASGSPSTGTVPRVVGLAAAPALRRLNVRGLRPIVVYVHSSQPANRVVNQSPAAGGTVQRGARVRAEVSTGPNPQPATAVPNVTGQDQASAANAIRSAGFRILVLNRPASDESRDGNAVEQQPHAGANIPADSLVAIFVGRFRG